MRTFEKWTTRFLAGGIAAGILVTVSPFLGCFYWNHQFEKLIRLKIDVPDCQKSIPGGRSECCQCFLAFDGVRSADEIQFLGDRLKYSFDSERRIFLVAGEGKLKSGTNSIQLASGRIYVNGQLVPVRSTPLRVLIRRDGHLAGQFCDVAW